MSERGTYASLSAGLLARKGEATPAMESFGRQPQPKVRRSEPVEPVDMLTPVGEKPPAEPAKPRAPLFDRLRRAGRGPQEPEAAQRAEPAPPADAVAAPVQPTPDPQATPQPDAAPGCGAACEAADEAERPGGPRAAVTVRLQTSAFLRLKLASAQHRRTSQDLLAAALDEYLDRLGVQAAKNCACLRRAAEAEAAARAAKA